uniref:GST N-terminal domain-containing protein n=1 Tax=Rhodosorus marinus TaxID=101924 RepID=A0A7S3EKV0_9RHOD|mmetsp:Transcript_43975/g.171745  ORF Transcript_43975/g.171745 Transcript_43975/m.171745 type:complete len:229 (+) Transcript_43975:118-804(+)
MMKMNSVLSQGRRLSSAMLKRFSSAATHSVELYQYEVCPFCAKAKATMDYYKVPYSTVEVNPLSKKELAFSEYKKVPLAVIDGKHVIESDAIMDLVRGWKTKEKPSADELKWRDWANQKLVVCLPPNLYRNLPESWDSFKYISQNNKFGLAQSLYVRSVGSVFMRMMKGRMMKKTRNYRRETTSYESTEYMGSGRSNGEKVSGRRGQTRRCRPSSFWNVTKHGGSPNL